MRYFAYNEYDENGGQIVIMSEEDIRKEYWSYWYGKMCNKFGKDHVDERYSFEDCLDDWQVVHWALEVKE